jgi:phenylalanyl-tRNA synthetase alpha subunit
LSDLATLEAEILASIASATDEAALETVRVGALGKKGSVSALLATLGKMAPDERKVQGAAINAVKDKRGSPAKPSTSRCRRVRPRPSRAASIRSAR